MTLGLVLGGLFGLVAGGPAGLAAMALLGCTITLLLDWISPFRNIMNKGYKDFLVNPYMTALDKIDNRSFHIGIGRCSSYTPCTS